MSIIGGVFKSHYINRVMQSLKVFLKTMVKTWNIFGKTFQRTGLIQLNSVSQ